MKPMAPLDEEARAWLEAADARYEPSPADSARVKAGVARALTVVPVSGASGLTGARESNVHPAAASAGGGSGFALGLGQKALLGALLVGGTGFLGGFFAGRQSVEGPVPELVAPDRAIFENTSSPAIHIAPEEPSDPVSEPSAPPPHVKVTAQDNDRASASTSATSNALEDSTSTLWQETQLLRRAQRALRDGNARLASALLDQLKAEIPKGTLVEERAAARVLTDCGLGNVERARRGAQSFFERYPASVHRERLQRSCAKLPARTGSSDATPID